MAYVTQDQFAALDVIADATLTGEAPRFQSGDILIHHQHSGTTGAYDKKGFHVSTVSILTDIGVTFWKMIDSMGGVGIRYKYWPTFHDDCTVFRPIGVGNPEADGAAAAFQAETFLSAGVGYSSFGVGRAIRAGLGGKLFPKFGSGAQARLAKYHGRETPVPKNCICSEFVVLCYQMAPAEACGHFINLDAKYTTPWGLLSYLLKDINWRLVGRVQGKSK